MWFQMILTHFFFVSAIRLVFNSIKKIRTLLNYVNHQGRMSPIGYKTLWKNNVLIHVKYILFAHSFCGFNWENSDFREVKQHMSCVIQ